MRSAAVKLAVARGGVSPEASEAHLQPLDRINRVAGERLFAQGQSSAVSLHVDSVEEIAFNLPTQRRDVPFVAPEGDGRRAVDRLHRRAASTSSNVSEDMGVMRVEREDAYCGRSWRCRLVWKNTVSVPATRPCLRSFSAPRVACAVMA
jgi:hypothetical protein